MVSRIVFNLINKLACFFKGESYALDDAVPVSSLIFYGLSRTLALLRCFCRGIRFTLNPKKLIFIGSDVVLKNRRQISFGRGVTIERGAYIDGLSIKGVTIGDNVKLGAYTIIEPTGVLTSIGNGFSIGSNSGVGAFSFIGAAGGVAIGENVIIGQRASFHSENHVIRCIDIPIRNQGVTRQGIRIEDDCWIGANVTFLDGATVGKGCVIAAGAVVRTNIPPYSIAAGIPATVIRNRKDG